jgi:hypothetical protein
MQETDILATVKDTQKLIADEQYFKYVFKKTEKIVCAVFYIVAARRRSGVADRLFDEVESQGLAALAAAAGALSLRPEASGAAREELVGALVLLESKLRVLHSAGHLNAAHVNVFAAEIDAAIRSARSPRMESERAVPSATRTSGSVRTSAPRSSAPTTTTRVSGASREERHRRIKDALRAKPNASIRDIKDIVRDCGEKTIQRDLSDMIETGEVVREGEKRWSRYKLTNGA